MYSAKKNCFFFFIYQPKQKLDKVKQNPGRGGDMKYLFAIHWNSMLLTNTIATRTLVCPKPVPREAWDRLLNARRLLPGRF